MNIKFNQLSKEINRLKTKKKLGISERIIHMWLKIVNVSILNTIKRRFTHPEKRNGSCRENYDVP